MAKRGWHFSFARLEHLPRLAWCARLRRGDARVEVMHGPWVETRDGAFCEGAWDGDFASTSPDRAPVFAGTAGRIADGAAIFAAGTDRHATLFATRTVDALLLSNSWCFLLTQADDRPSLSSPYYVDLFHRAGKLGVDQVISLPSERGRFEVHACHNLEVTPDLAIVRVAKPALPAPHDFASYAALLDGAVGRLLANARDPARARGYEPLVLLSSGYDSTAVAALGRAHGCARALTLRQGEDNPTYDQGLKAADALGLAACIHPRAGAGRHALPFPDAEFAVCPPGSLSVLMGADVEIEGKVLLSGDMGDKLWGDDDKAIRPQLAGYGVDHYSAASLNEARLRTGALVFPVPYVGWQHSQAIRRIGKAPEMAAFVLGRDYDRPIPRRIAEERGVPRPAFGRRKAAGAHRPIIFPNQLLRPSRDDYRRFVATVSLSSRDRLTMHVEHALATARHHWTKASKRIPFPLPARRWAPAPADAFVLHWAFERVRERYLVDE